METASTDSDPPAQKLQHKLHTEDEEKGKRLLQVNFGRYVFKTSEEKK